MENGAKYSDVVRKEKNPVAELVRYHNNAEANRLIIFNIALPETLAFAAHSAMSFPFPESFVTATAATLTSAGMLFGHLMEVHNRERFAEKLDRVKTFKVVKQLPVLNRTQSLPGMVLSRILRKA